MTTKRLQGTRTLLFVALIAIASNALAVTIEQITNSNVIYNTLEASEDNSKIVFKSSYDLTGNNPDLLPQAYSMNSDGTNLLQVTRFTETFIFDPKLSANGDLIFYLSNYDPFGTNSDGIELFVMDFDGSNVLQLTNSIYPVDGFHVFDSGNQVIFISRGDYTGENPNNSSALFVVNADGSNTRQLINNLPLYAGKGLKVSKDQKRVIYGSPVAIFELDIETKQNRTLIELNEIYDAAITDSADTLIVSSNADPLGINPERNVEIFLFDTVAQHLTQLTDQAHIAVPVPNDSPILIDIDSVNLRLSADEQQFYFVSSGDFTGNNTNNFYQLFSYNLNAGTFQQLTMREEQSGINSYQVSQDGEIAIIVSILPFGEFVETRLVGLATSEELLLGLNYKSSPHPFESEAFLSANGNSVLFESTDDPQNKNPYGRRQIMMATDLQNLFPSPAPPENPEQPGQPSADDAAQNGDGGGGGVSWLLFLLLLFGGAVFNRGNV